MLSTRENKARLYRYKKMEAANILILIKLVAGIVDKNKNPRFNHNLVV